MPAILLVLALEIGHTHMPGSPVKETGLGLNDSRYTDSRAGYNTKKGSRSLPEVRTDLPMSIQRVCYFVTYRKLLSSRLSEC